MPPRKVRVRVFLAGALALGLLGEFFRVRSSGASPEDRARSTLRLLERAYPPERHETTGAIPPPTGVHPGRSLGPGTNPAPSDESDAPWVPAYVEEIRAFVKQASGPLPWEGGDPHEARAFTLLLDAFSERLWNDPPTLLLVLDQIEHDEDPDVRMALRVVLHSQGGAKRWLRDPEVAEDLVWKWLSRDKPDDVRATAADLLGSQHFRPYPPDGADVALSMRASLVGEIARRLRQPDSAEVRINLLRALTHFQGVSPGATDSVLAVATNRAESVNMRLTAAALLSYSARQDPFVGLAIERALPEESDPTVRAKLLEALDTEGAGASVEAVRRVLLETSSGDLDALTRAGAASRLLDLNAPEAMTDLRRYMAEESSEESRATVADAIGWRMAGDDVCLKERVEILRGVVRQDASSPVRVAAVRSLGQLLSEFETDSTERSEMLLLLEEIAAADVSPQVRQAAASALGRK
ncbi:MAG: HEAT repeat domain-containing protein [Planctomycetes bacterium]|nr:HEAT repeat domain-containing protein [Planctomycetota bacterium]